jgi:hypothetical protein
VRPRVDDEELNWLLAHGPLGGSSPRRKSEETDDPEDEEDHNGAIEPEEQGDGEADESREDEFEVEPPASEQEPDAEGEEDQEANRNEDAQGDESEPGDQVVPERGADASAGGNDSDHDVGRAQTSTVLATFAPRVELVPGNLDTAVEDIRRGWDLLDRHFVRGYLGLSERLRAARDLYNAEFGKGRGKRGKANQAPVPDFASYMKDRLGRDASLINKIIQFSDIDPDCRRMIEERPQLGRDFTVLHALAGKKDPDKREQAIDAFDRGGRKEMMAVLKPAKARVMSEAKVERPEPSPPSPVAKEPLDEGPKQAAAEAGPEKQTPPKTEQAKEPEREPEPEPESPPTASEHPTETPKNTTIPSWEQALADLVVAYQGLLRGLPGIHPIRLLKVVENLLPLVYSPTEPTTKSAVRTTLDTLRVEQQGGLALKELLRAVPNSAQPQSKHQKLIRYRDSGRSITPKWVAEQAKNAPATKKTKNDNDGTKGTPG